MFDELLEQLREAVTFLDKTDMPLYDQMMKNPEYYKREKNMEYEIIPMSPQKYIDVCVEGLWNFSHQVRREFKFDKNLLKHAVEKDRTITVQQQPFWQKEDHDFYMPVLEFGPDIDFKQEGLHRALVARKENLSEIPVFVMFNKIDKEQVKREYGL